MWGERAAWGRPRPPQKAREQLSRPAAQEGGRSRSPRRAPDRCAALGLVQESEAALCSCPMKSEAEAGPPPGGSKGPAGQCLVTRFHKSQGHGLTTQQESGVVRDTWGGGRCEAVSGQVRVVPVPRWHFPAARPWALPQVGPPEEAARGSAASSQSSPKYFADMALSPPPLCVAQGHTGDRGGARSQPRPPGSKQHGHPETAPYSPRVKLGGPRHDDMACLWGQTTENL